jgi:hypothetical protein
VLPSPLYNNQPQRCVATYDFETNDTTAHRKPSKACNVNNNSSIGTCRSACLMRKATADETGTVQSTDSRSDDKGRTKN